MTTRDLPASTKELLDEIDAFQARHPEVKDSAIGNRAVRDGKFVGRLRRGGRLFPETASRVRAWMQDYDEALASPRRESTARR